VPFYSYSIPNTIAITNASAATPTSQAALITSTPVTTAPATTDTIAIIDTTTNTLKQVAVSDLVRFPDGDKGDITVTSGVWSIDDGVVTGNKLEDSPVTAGAYISANITVDSKGRIIAATNGSGGSGDTSYGFVEVARTVTGTTPLLVAEFTLPAGIYTEFSAVIGSAISTTIATLTIKNPAGTTLKTLTRTGTPLQVSTIGFTLATDTLVGFYLSGDTTTTQSYIFSLGVK
jgi:hypothetical protein